MHRRAQQRGDGGTVKLVLQTLIDAFSVGSLYALVALGLAVVFGIMRLVNWAHGELIVIGGYLMYVLTGRPAALMVTAVVACVIAAALLMNVVAFRPLRRADTTTLLIASFALSYLLQSAFLVAFTSFARPISALSTLSKPVELAGFRVPIVTLVTIAVTAGVLSVLVVFLRKTDLGLQMRGAAEDFEMSRLLGVPANRVIGIAFAISGALAGIVAVLYFAQQGIVSPTSGVQPLIVAFVAVVLGGMGTLSGAVLGGFIVGVCETGFQALLPASLGQYRQAFVFLLVIVFLLLRPQGLLPPKSITGGRV